MTIAAPLPAIQPPKPALQMAQRIFVWTSAVVLFGLWAYSIHKGQEQKWISFAFMLLALAYVFSVSSTQIVTLLTGGRVMEAVAAATGVIAAAETAATTAFNRATEAMGGTPAPAPGSVQVNVNPAPAPEPPATASEGGRDDLAQ